jgi:hypothetical protein
VTDTNTVTTAFRQVPEWLIQCLFNIIANKTECLRSVMKKMHGPEKEVTGECRKLHNEEPHNLHSSPNHKG